VAVLYVNSGELWVELHEVRPLAVVIDTSEDNINQALSLEALGLSALPSADESSIIDQTKYIQQPSYHYFSQLGSLQAFSRARGYVGVGNTFECTVETDLHFKCISANEYLIYFYKPRDGSELLNVLTDRIPET